MPELNRRSMIEAAAAVVTMPGLVHAQEQNPNAEPLKPGKTNAKYDEKADRKRVIACGMTEAEADCWEAVAKAAGKFFELPKLHPMDDHEVAHAIHVIQNKLLGRPTYRKYLELAKAEGKERSK